MPMEEAVLSGEPLRLGVHCRSPMCEGEGIAFDLAKNVLGDRKFCKAVFPPNECSAPGVGQQLAIQVIAGFYRFPPSTFLIADVIDSGVASRIECRQRLREVAELHPRFIER